MAVDKLVDSTQLDSDLTSVANAIRAKSGGSSSLAFPSGFVSEIQAIPSGGGGMTMDWADVTEVTIGANSVTKTSGVNTYFSGYSYHLIVLASPITVSKQFVYGRSEYADGTLSGASRKESDSRIRNCAVDNSYDCYLVEGSKYYLFKMKTS